MHMYIDIFTHTRVHSATHRSATISTNVDSEELLSRNAAAQDLIRTFDPNGDGVVSSEEFMRFALNLQSQAASMNQRFKENIDNEKEGKTMSDI